MNVGPLHAIAGAAGAPLSQAKGADADRTAEESRQAQAQAKVDAKGQVDASIDENQETADRDGDGRSVILVEPESPDSSTPDDESTQQATGSSRDPTGELGSRLDISG